MFAVLSRGGVQTIILPARGSKDRVTSRSVRFCHCNFLHH